MTPKLKKIIILVLIIALMFVIYTLTNKSEPQADPLLTGGVTENETTLLGTQIAQALLRIEQIKLDKAIFENQMYKTLQDRSVTIESERWGRSNPFAPIGSISSSSSTDQNTTSTTTPAATSTPPATSGTTSASTTPATGSATTSTTQPPASRTVTPSTN